MRRHWALIEAGRYSAAYDGFAPALRARLPRAGWIERLTHDGLRHVEVDVDVTAVSADTASARVASLRTVAAGSGCHTWTGSYALQRIDGVWRISDSQLVRHPC